VSERAGHSLFSLAGQVALVTGAGSPGGIGFATAQLLAELGCQVALCATSMRIRDRRHGRPRDAGFRAQRGVLRTPRQ
jgi:NAD(P)-dependent dehydrogenase (short-subunit alcohol dehydrogenase family)